MKDALGQEIRRGDKLEASDAYKRHIEENYPAGTSAGIPDNFVVHKIKHGPFWDRNANGFHEGGWMEDTVYNKEGSRFQSWEVRKVSD